MMSLRAGAASATGVEFVTQLARISETIIASNRPTAEMPNAPLPDSKTAPLDIWCTDARGVSPPPENLQFDVLVSELMDASGLGENLILLTRGARQRLCNSDAVVIPANLRLLGVLCEVKYPSIAGVNLDAFWPLWPAEKLGASLWLGVDLDKGDGIFRILTQPVEIMSLELGSADVQDVPSKKDLDFKGIENGVANMVVWWFETQLSKSNPSIVLTNAPNCVDSKHLATCWGQAMAQLPSHASVKKEKLVPMTMEVPFGDYQLTFRPRGEARRAGTVESITTPPGSLEYSAEFLKDMKAYKDFISKTSSDKKSNAIGRAALRTADIPALGALLRCSSCVATQPYLFNVEPSTAAKMLAGWYAVGGEGRY